jgi:hypothetical protein
MVRGLKTCAMNPKWACNQEVIAHTALDAQCKLSVKGLSGQEKCLDESQQVPGYSTSGEVTEQPHDKRIGYGRLTL